MQKKLTRIVVVTIAALLCSYSSARAQSDVTNLNRELVADLSQAVVNFDTIYNLKVVVELSDTLNIQSIDLSVGSALDNADFFDGAFDFNALTGPAGTSISRAGNLLEITLGTVHSGAVFFYQVSTSDFQGNTGTPYIKQL